MLVTDGFENLVANIGTQKDKASFAGWRGTVRTPEQYEEIYQSSAFGRKVVDIPVDDMTRRWRGWSASDEHVEAMEAAEKRFEVRERFAAAARWARLHGSSAIIVGMSPRHGLPSDPLKLDDVRPGDLRYLHVDIYPRLQIAEWDADIESPRFGKPRLYLYQPVIRGGAGDQQVRIHASRVIPFSGRPLPPLASQRWAYWGDSILAALEDQLNTAGSALAVIASLIYETKLDVISTDLAALGTPDGEARLLKRFSLASTLKSINNTLLLGKDDKYEQKTFNFAGLPEIHIRLLQELCGAADIPATRFLSQAPAGMQSTGESDYRNYADMISSKQETDYRPGLEYLDTILAANQGLKVDVGSFFYFHPLWQESATQKAENALKYATATEKLVNTATIPDVVMRKAVISQLVEAGTYPALEAAMKEYEGTEPAKDDGEHDEAHAAALAAAEAAAERPRLRIVGADGQPAGVLYAKAVEPGNEVTIELKGSAQ